MPKHTRSRPGVWPLLAILLASGLVGPVQATEGGPAAELLETYGSVQADRYNSAHQLIERDFTSRENFSSFGDAAAVNGASSTLSASMSGSVGGAFRGVSASATASASIVAGGSSAADGFLYVKFRVNRPVYVSARGSLTESGGGSAWFPYATDGTTSRCVIVEPGIHSFTASASAFSSPSGSSSMSFSLTFYESPATDGIGDSACAAVFDWSMVDRYVVDPSTGLPSPFEPDGTLDATPDGFSVRLQGQACGGRPARWLIDGNPIGDGCERIHLFPGEGTYDVTLQILDSGVVIAELTQQVEVSDILIVSIGDSVASGEGVPNTPASGIGTQPVWGNRQCHRSPRAGPAQAALALEQANPKTSVTFVHLACSGATVASGLIGPYAGQEPGPLLDPQVDQMRQIVGSREVDALLVSIGANDVHFKEIVISCLTQSECHDRSAPGSAANQFDALVSLLPTWYELLADALSDVTPERVFLTEYFDPTRDEEGTFCDDEILEDVVNAPLVGVSADEARWAGTDMLPTLNAVGDASAAAHGWRRVGGIFEEFETHGYCALFPWIRLLGESMEYQGWIDGSLHPNEEGHFLYAALIAATVAATI